MSSLKIYVQRVPFKDEPLRETKFKYFLSQSDFDIGCLCNSLFSNMSSAEEGVAADIFDVFRMWENQISVFNSINEPIIAVRKHLSAHIRREWMREDNYCVWVTVPSRGCRSRLHVACVDFIMSPDIDLFTKTLTFLSKTHVNDKFLVVGRFPDNWITKEHHLILTPRGEIGNNINRLRSSLSLAGLAQFYNIECNAVLSSIPVTVMHCPRPFLPEENSCQIALEFSLHIGPSECCKTATDATGDNCTNELSGQREAKIEERLRMLEERVLQHREISIDKTAREANGESPSMSGDSKRTKIHEDSNEEALTGVKMAVIADNHPASTLGEDMLKPIRSVLWGMLNTTPDPLPKVCLDKMISGVVHFTCEGEGAVKWLSRINGTTVGDAKLRVVSAEDIPKPVKMAWKSRNDSSVDTANVLNVLQRYNPSLRTAEWKVVEVLVEEGNVRRIVYMDKVSADIIKTKNYSLYSGLESTSFKLLEDSETKVGGHTGQKAAEVIPTADPQDPEVLQQGPQIQETERERTTSPTSLVRTNELLGVERLSLQPAEGMVEEGAAGGP